MKFTLRKILNFADGRMLTSMEDIYEFANFMTGDDLFTHQLPRAFREIEPVLKKQLPFLATGDFDLDTAKLTRALHDATDKRAVIGVWLAEMTAKYGDEHEVTPLADWMKQNPISELIQMRESREGIILVQAPDAQPSN